MNWDSMKIYYIGHAAFYVSIEDKSFLFDPWIEGNPVAVVKEELRPDYIFVSHGHFDHGLKDAVEISKRTNAKLVGVFELVKASGIEGITGNIGGTIKEGDVEIYFTTAVHSCPYGTPAGFVVSYKGKTIYHAGDTGLTRDMEFISKLYKIDVAFLPIGGVYTLSTREVEIAQDMVKAKHIIPMHYNTFPAIKADPEKLKEKLDNVVVLKPGEEVEI